MADTHLVSVIIPTCDRPDYLDRALHSLEIQTRRDFEAVVVNDGEIPVAAVVKKYAGAFPISLVEHEHKRSGLPTARNSGLAQAQGRRITFLDDDDYFYENHLEVMSEALNISNYLVVYADALLAEQRDFGQGYETVSRRLPLSEDFNPAVLAFRNIMPVLCAVFEHSCLRLSGPFAPYLRGHEDWDLWQRLARFFPFRHLPVLTGEYTSRVSATSLSGNIETMRDSWIFCRRQGALHQAVPPVYDLGRMAQEAKILMRGKEPCAVSVILTPAHQDAATAGRLAACLAALPDDAEPVLVLPNASTAADFVAALAPHCRRKPCVVTTQGDAGRVLAANLGASAALGRVLLFLEEDVVPQPGAVTATAAFLESTPGACMAGGIMEAPGLRPTAGGKHSARGELIFAAAPTDADAPLPVTAVSSLALAVRREQFLEIGGFDTAFAPGHYADADLAHRLTGPGCEPFIVPKARFEWNHEALPLVQTPAGLISRRAYWDRRLPGAFDPERLLQGSDWALRAVVRPSDGIMPESFDFTLPSRLRPQTS